MAYPENNLLKFIMNLAGGCTVCTFPTKCLKSIDQIDFDSRFALTPLQSNNWIITLRVYQIESSVGSARRNKQIGGSL